MQAAKLCKFVPGTLDGVPSEASYLFTYTWETGKVRKGLARCILGAYPLASVNLGEQGVAVVKVLRKADDEMELRLARSTGYPRLDRETMEFAKRCTEHAIVKDDFPVGQALQQPLAWSVMD